MGSPYYQFCPVAKAMELLDERWTLLVIRELAAGSTRFNELRRGLPRMSPTLLSKRLRHLTAAGVVERRADAEEPRYVLTPAGEELRPVVEALGMWGVRWIGRLGDADLDPKLLLWDMRRRVNHTAIPDGRTVVAFRFPDAPANARVWWLVLDAGGADVCDIDPGFPVTLTVTGRLRRMVEIWRGDRTWSDATRTGEIEILGPRHLRQAMPNWFDLSPFAAAPRPNALVGVAVTPPPA